MSEFYLSLDQGTTSSRAILYSADGTKHSEASVEIDSNYPQPGWVEQSPTAILDSISTVLRQVVETGNIAARQIKAIGITNQRETTVLWDKKTGEALHPAIVWQDRRTAKFCMEQTDQQFLQSMHQKTGLVLDPYFSATKIAWILENISAAKSALKNNQLAFGTIDSFLLWHLTDDHQHMTDITNASRTLLFNIQNHSWDDDLLEFFNIPSQILPQVKPCCFPYGLLSKRFLGVEIPILAMIGDQQSASIGQGCIQAEQVKATYGTGCFMLLNTGVECVYSKNQLLSTIAYQVKNHTTYALEGSVFVAGALIKWLRNSLKLFKTEEEIETIIAQSKSHNGHTLFVPALSGLGAPHWAPEVKGALFGLTQDTSIADILRAGMEGICFQTRDLIESLKRDYPHPLKQMKVDGGMANNGLFLQTLANVLQMEVVRSRCVEATAFGAFLITAVEAGAFETLQQAVMICKSSHCYTPTIDRNSADGQYRNWLDHIEKLRD